MAYSKTTWVNGGPPPISAENLNNMEDGIYNNDLRVTDLVNTAARKRTGTIDYSLRAIDGLVTGGAGTIEVFLPIPYIDGTTVTLQTVELIARHIEGGYPYMRVGSTYTALGSSYVTLMSSGTAISGVNSISVLNRSDIGFTLQIGFTNPLCKTSGNQTAIANNVPIALTVHVKAKIT